MKTPDYIAELHSYLKGFCIAFCLTLLPFALVAFRVTDLGTTLWVIALCALLQIVAQFRYFLHIDLSRQKREDLLLILFSAANLAIMCAGTLWIITSLEMRM